MAVDKEVWRQKFTSNYTGWDVGPGWEKIVEKALQEIEEIDPTFRIDQIKEKFGGLRIYVTSPMGLQNEIQKVIRRAESAADETCSLCSVEYEGQADVGFSPRCGEHRSTGLWASARVREP
jgi:hypothetical protein